MSKLQLSQLIAEHRDIYDYCEKKYLKEWSAINYKNFKGEAEFKKLDIRREAQRDAIDKTLINCLVKYADDESVTDELLWALISAAHKYNLAHLQDFGISKDDAMLVYDRCISAHQSWNKASGHSFERYISRVQTSEMKENEVEFVLQKDILRKIKNGQLSNAEKDLKLIQNWAENFDLYAVQTIHKKPRIFGCIQIKTSIRDRVGRDDQFSKLSMDNCFWTVEAVLNGAFFRLPKYKAMVNGGSETYPTNNWHGVYAMSGIRSDGRLYRDDDAFRCMGNHAVQAAHIFSVNRPQLNREWKAK